MPPVFNVSSEPGCPMEEEEKEEEEEMEKEENGKDRSSPYSSLVRKYRKASLCS